MLNFHELLLENYRAYRGQHRVKLDLPPGLYYVRGVNNLYPELESNGAAKTTLFNALSWCLFGKELDDERPGAAVEPWGGSGPTAVEVGFSRHDEFYRVRRGRNPNTCALARYSEEADSVGADAFEFEECDQAKVDEALGLSYEVFKCTVVLPQFGAQFLDMRSEDQSQMFNDTLGLDLWLRAADNAATLARDADADLVSSAMTVQELLGKAAEVAEGIAREEQLSADYERARAEKLAVTMANVKHLEAERAATVVEEPADLPRELDLDEVQTAVDDLATSLNEKSLELESVERAAGELARTIKAARDRADSYKNNPKVCPECKQAVKPAHFAVKTKQENEYVAKLEPELGDTARKGAKLKREVVDLSERLRTQRDGLERGRERLRRWEADERVRTATRAGLDRQIQSQREQLKALGAAKDPHAATADELRTKAAEIVAEHDRLQEQQVSLEWQKEAYGYWAQAYKEVRLDIVDEALASMEEAANKGAEELGLYGWLVQFATEKTAQSGKVSRGFNVVLWPPGNDKPERWKSYCGGERQRWQLAARFAMSEVMLARAGLSPNIEILDEPSAHMSPAGVEHLLSCLRERALRLGRAVWVVEHHSLDSGQFDGVVTVTHDEEGSRVELV